MEILTKCQILSYHVQMNISRSSISRVINVSYCKLDSKYKVTTMDRDTETRGNKHKHILRHVTTRIKMTNQS